MILSNIKQFLGRNKKIFYYISLFFIVSFSISDVTFAASGDTMAASVAKGANEFLSIVSLFMGLLTYLATMFLSPEWYNGTLFGMNTKFKEIWIMISNIVYFIFAFLLIWIAFMNIIGKNTEQYQLKQALPKFIVGVLIVPFSWFLVQFILSISAILTVSALTLPFDTFNDFKGAAFEISIPAHCKVDLSKDGKEFYDCNPDGVARKPVLLSELFGSGDAASSIYGVLTMYTHGVTGIADADSLKFDETAMSKITQLGDIAMKLIFDVLFVAIYFILLVALGLVLMIRGIYIWIYIMLSPIFGLMYFFDKKDGGGDGFFAKFNLKEFIALVMVPVYTMLALSFGLLFIYMVGTGLKLESNNTFTSFSIESSDGGKESSIVLGSKPEYQVRFTVAGALGTAPENLSKLVSGGKNATLGFIGILILKLFGIVVLWGTVMAAMRTSEITKAIVEPLHQFGTKVGGIVSSAPGNIPIFGGQSMKSLGQAASTIDSSINQRASTKGSDLAGKFIDIDGYSKEINKHMLANDDTSRKKGIDYMIKNLDGANANQIKGFNNMLKKYGYDGDLELKQNETNLQKAKKLSIILSSDKIKFDQKGSTNYKATNYIENRIDNGDSAIRNPSNSGGDNNFIKGKNYTNYSSGYKNTDTDPYKYKADKSKQGIEVVVKTNTGGTEISNIEFNTTGSSSVKISANDRKDAKYLYDLTGRDSEKMKVILADMGFNSGNIQELIDDIEIIE